MKDGKLEKRVIIILTIVFTLIIALLISVSVYRMQLAIKNKNNNPVEQQSVVVPVNKNEPVAQDFTTYPVSDSELNQMAVQFNNQNTGTTNSTVVDQSTTNQDVVLQGLNGDLNKPVSEPQADDNTAATAQPNGNSAQAVVSQVTNGVKKGFNSIVSSFENFLNSF